MSGPSPGEGEEDARSEESFQSADEDDDFDLPQDLGGPAGGEKPAAGSAGGGGALPPGFDDGDAAAAERWNLRKDGNKEQLEPIWTRLSAEREHVKISKMFSYVLRHAAHKLDVRIRKDGFVRLKEIMKLRNFRPYNLEELMAVIYFDEKERYTMVREFDGELLIRANQGHTMKVVESDLLLEQITDPTTVTECVHGTYLVHWPFIKRQGLSKVARNHIHLANGLPEDGKIRGMRSTAELFVYVNVPLAMEEGIIFYRSKNDVILTQGDEGWLRAKYFFKAVRIDYNTCDIEELEFDREATVPTWAAELAPSGPGEQGTYLIKNLEALISNCRKRLQDINELKALQEAGQDLNDEEVEKIGRHAQVYTELQSLEQRFRQHKGYRRESANEKENRAKEEQELGTIVKRKDRAVTPPWERGKTHMESVGTKATEKEKAEWAALGRRRDTAAEKDKTALPVPKKDDPWEAMGKARQTAAPTPKAKDDAPRREDSSKFGDSWRFGRSDSQKLDRADSQRLERAPSGLERGTSGRFDKADDKKAGGSTPASTTANRDGPPRFINSKKDSGTSWRDRMAGNGPPKLRDESPPSRQPESSPKAQEASWRTQAPELPPPPSHAPAAALAPPPVPAPPTTIPNAISGGHQQGEPGGAAQYAGGQPTMYYQQSPYGSQAGMYYVAASPSGGQQTVQMSQDGSWMYGAQMMSPSSGGGQGNTGGMLMSPTGQQAYGQQGMQQAYAYGQQAMGQRQNAGQQQQQGMGQPGAYGYQAGGGYGYQQRGGGAGDSYGAGQAGGWQQDAYTYDDGDGYGDYDYDYQDGMDDQDYGRSQQWQGGGGKGGRGGGVSGSNSGRGDKGKGSKKGGGGKDGKKGGGGGGGGRSPGGFGKDRSGGGDDDWAALGRMRAAP